MLEIVCQMELEKVQINVNDSICFSTQVDGSLDDSQSDNKFVCVQWIEADGALSTAFIGVVQPNERGAKNRNCFDWTYARRCRRIGTQ